MRQSLLTTVHRTGSDWSHHQHHRP